MIRAPQTPRLPDNLRGTYFDDLNWMLSQVLPEMVREINKMSGSTWNGPHPILGSYHLWIDATGDLRINSSAPTSDLDGTVVGTQS